MISLPLSLSYREKKWVEVGPNTCTLKLFKWVPGMATSSILDVYYSPSCNFTCIVF